MANKNQHKWAAIIVCSLMALALQHQVQARDRKTLYERIFGSGCTDVEIKVFRDPECQIPFNMKNIDTTLIPNNNQIQSGDMCNSLMKAIDNFDAEELKYQKKKNKILQDQYKLNRLVDETIDAMIHFKLLSGINMPRDGDEYSGLRANLPDANYRRDKAGGTNIQLEESMFCKEPDKTFTTYENQTVAWIKKKSAKLGVSCETLVYNVNMYCIDIFYQLSDYKVEFTPPTSNQQIGRFKRYNCSDFIRLADSYCQLDEKKWNDKDTFKGCNYISNYTFAYQPSYYYQENSDIKTINAEVKNRVQRERYAVCCYPDQEKILEESKHKHWLHDEKEKFETQHVKSVDIECSSAFSTPKMTLTYYENNDCTSLFHPTIKAFKEDRGNLAGTKNDTDPAVQSTSLWKHFYGQQQSLVKSMYDYNLKQLTDTDLKLSDLTEDDEVVGRHYWQVEVDITEDPDSCQRFQMPQFLNTKYLKKSQNGKKQFGYYDEDTFSYRWDYTNVQEQQQAMTYYLKVSKKNTTTKDVQKKQNRLGDENIVKCGGDNIFTQVTLYPDPNCTTPIAGQNENMKRQIAQAFNEYLYDSKEDCLPYPKGGSMQTYCYDDGAGAATWVYSDSKCKYWKNMGYCLDTKTNNIIFTDDWDTPCSNETINDKPRYIKVDGQLGLGFYQFDECNYVGAGYWGKYTKAQRLTAISVALISAAQALMIINM